VLSAFGLSIAAIFLLTAISHISLTPARFDAAVKTAFAAHELDYERTPSDQFTECALLTMEHLRPKSVAENAVNTRFAHDYHFHPCDVLRHIVLGVPQHVELEGVNRPGYQANYVSYPFGARHLAGLALSVMELSTYRWLLGILAAVSILSLTIGAARSDPRKALLCVAPITVMLVAGFSLHAIGTNFAHGPDCWVAFFMLSAFLAFADFFRPLYRRVAFAVSLGVVVTFFDMFDGAAPVAVMLLVFLNQAFYVPEQASWRVVIGQAALMTAAVLGAFIAYTVLRLFVIGGIFGIDWRPYVVGISARAGLDVGGTRGIISLPDVFQELWAKRRFLVWGSETASTILLIVSGLSWVCAATLFAVKRHYLSRWTIATFAVAVGCSVGTLGWFVLFPNHTYVHAHFMIRILVVPMALGFATSLFLTTTNPVPALRSAVALLFDNAEGRRWIPVAVVGGLAVLGVALALLWRAWGNGLPALPTFTSVTAPAAAPADAPGKTVGLKDFQAFKEQIAATMQSTTQLVAARQAEIKRMSDQVSALAAKIETLHNPATLAQAVAPPPAPPAARKKPAAAKLSTGDPPLPLTGR
jgi:uncharacterized coiled-coil protein SlyX